MFRGGGLRLSVAAALLFVFGAGCARPRKVDVEEKPVETDFSWYTTEELVSLSAHSSKSITISRIAVGEEALKRVLTPDQDAWVRYNLGNAYISHRMGAEGRQKLMEVFERYPDFELNVELAAKLARYFTYNRPLETKDDPEQAIRCYERVLDLCDKTKVYYEANCAHMGLGNLYCRKEEYQKAHEHFEALYNADPAKVEPLPSKDFASEANREGYRAWVREILSYAKKKMPTKLVGTCYRDTMEDTVKAMEQLKADYASDPVMVAAVEAAIAEVVARHTPKVTEGAVVTAWNEDALSPWLRADYLAKSLPAWQVKQMAWPDAEEVQAASVAVEERLKTWCVKGLSKHIKPEYLPAEIENKLVAMNDREGVGDPKVSEPLRDAFLVRYTTGGIVIHIHEDPCYIIVAVAPAAAEAKARSDHKEFLVETAGLILIADALNDPVLGNTDVESLSVKTTTTASGSTVSTTSPSWTLHGATDGRFVRFRIRKWWGGPPDPPRPWEQRF